MVKVKLDNVEYEVEVPTKAWPLLAFIDDRRLNQPKNLEEAIKRGEELEQALEKVMEFCVTPKPPKALWNKMLTIINMLVNREVKETAEWFDKFLAERGG